MSSNEACTALDDTGQPCPCLAYREGDNPSPPIRCLECLHGRSQHRREEAKASIASILQGIVKKGAFSQRTVVSVEEATKETNNGLKKSAFKKPASKGKGKGKRTNKVDSGKAFRVMAVVVNYSGMEEVPVNETLEELCLIDSQVPDKQDVQVRSQYGLAKLSSCDEEDAIEFHSSWTFEEVDAALRSLFPDLFHYLDELEPAFDAEGTTLPPWMLCIRNQRRLQLLPQVRPTGMDLYFNKGTAKSGWQNCTIYIATRSEVPLSEVKSWASGPSSKPHSTSESKGKRKAVELGPTSNANQYNLRSVVKRRILSPGVGNEDSSAWTPPPLTKGFLYSPEPANGSTSGVLVEPETMSTVEEGAVLNAEASTSAVGPSTGVQEVISISSSPSPPPPAPIPIPTPALPSTPPHPARTVNPMFSGSSEIDASFENPYISNRTTFTF